MGASVGVRRTGALGVAGFFSFEPTKPVNTYGGGMLVTDDAGLASFARAQTVDDVPRPKILLRKVRAVQMEQLLYRSNLMLPVLVALNNRLFNLVFNGVYRRFQAVPPADSAYLPVQAEIGLRKLTTLEDRIARRESLVHLYRELLKPVIKLQQPASKDRSTWYFLVATLPVKAATVRQRILLRGIDCAVESEIADDCATAMNLDKCPVVRELYPRLMALPLYDSMTENEVARVARAINDRV
jgi:dTDP-4-amino-4,6-dideoxygalactose transaminase